VVAGAAHSCALHQDGTVSCWGLAESIDPGQTTIIAPAAIAGLSGVRGLAAGDHGTCAITAERQVRCWGAQAAYTVVKEDGVTPLGGVTSVALGLDFGCAANSEGTLCWGQNDLGQLARPLDLQESQRALLARPGPVAFLATGQTGFTHDGMQRLCAWGHNGTHEITAVDGMRVYADPQCADLPDVVQLVAGADHVCVRHANGTFACWGERYYGQLGIGGGVDDTADITPFGATTTLAPGVQQLALGASHSCALLVGGAVMCFGLNSKGQIGPDANTTADEVRAPVLERALPAVAALGAGPTAQHTCAILGDGSVMCWGSDSDGQLGDGVTTRDMDRKSAGPVSVRF
jgi:hypothetical protein